MIKYYVEGQNCNVNHIGRYFLKIYNKHVTFSRKLYAYVKVYFIYKQSYLLLYVKLKFVSP